MFILNKIDPIAYTVFFLSASNFQKQSIINMVSSLLLNDLSCVLF